MNRLREKIGAVLIEFAFAIPVFLVLLYYIHDLPKHKLLARKMQFVTNEMSAILQNIALQRSNEGSVIKKNDFLNAMRLAYLSIFPGNTMTWLGNNCWPLGYGPYAAAIYVKGTGNGIGQGKWIVKTMGDNGYEIYVDKQIATVCNLGFSEQNTAAKKFWPTLNINTNESKVILQCLLCYDKSGLWGMKFKDGTPCRNVSPCKAFGFLLFNPTGVGTGRGGFFPSVTIFTPQAGFSETPPRD